MKKGGKMLCPKCKHEVMNVNGRYVCVECGSELTEDQLEYDNGTASPTSPEVSGSTASDTVSSAQDIPANPLPNVEPEAASAEPTPDLPPEAAQSEETAPAPEEQTVSEIADSQAGAAEPTLVSAEASNAIETDTLSEPLQTETTTSTEELKPEPTVDTFEGPKEDLPAESSEAPVAVDPVFPEANVPTETPSDPPMAPQVPDMTSPSSQETPVEATPIAPVAEPLQSPVAAETTPQAVGPVDMFASAMPSNVDPNIYQNPIFDQPAASVTPGSSGKSDEELAAEKISSDNRKMYAILIMGAIVFIAFIIGGIIAYINLTK